MLHFLHLVIETAATKETNKTKYIPNDRTGQIVEWTSPLFWGEMRATVLEDLGYGVRVIHPLTEVECVIPTAWLTDVSS